MFADDTKVYRELPNIARDIETLQFGVYQLLLKTESLDNAILAFWLA